MLDLQDLIKDSLFTNLLAVIEDKIEEDTSRSKSTIINTIEHCYAVKKGVDGFLDIARKNFCKITEQIQELSQKYKESYELDQLKVFYR